MNTQPAGAAVGSPLATQPAVALIGSEAGINPLDNTTVVTVSIVPGTGTAGATLTGTTTATAVAGLATFTNLGINTAGTNYQLRFTAPTYGVADSTAFNITVPAPVRTLLVATQPFDVGPPAHPPTQPVIHVHSNGVLDTADNTTVVTASILAGTGNPAATLSGTTTATAVGGVATFTNLGVNLTGSNYQLRFTAPGANFATSLPFSVIVLGGVIPPSVPPASQVNFAIDSTQDVHAISRFIYGMNGWNPAVRPRNLTLSRSGGNRMTAYNWENNASNAGSDYQNQNDDFLGGGNTPNGAVGPGIADARAAGAGIVVTIPTLGYVAADKNGGGDVNLTTDYLTARFRQSLPRKGSAFSMTPNTADAFVYQDEYVNFLNQTYAGAFASATTPIFLSLDNEPDLWHYTHARLRGDATRPVETQNGTNVTYAELVQKSVDYARAAKDVNPAVLVFGPANYGWQGYLRLQNAADHQDRDFLNFYLAQMAQAETTAGRRLLDVLDVHWYPEARGACSVNPMDGCRISDGGAGANEPAVVAAREQAPRSLWDTGYQESSWIPDTLPNGDKPIRLLPRLGAKISANYPNTKLAITEYNYGGGDHISGGLAQADVLGIFGREGLFAANLWRLINDNSFIYGGFEMFRNYDRANGSFGDTSIRATNSDVANASVYASVNAGILDRMVMVVINKADTAQTAGIAVTHYTRFNTAKVYTLTSANSVPQAQADLHITLTNAFQYSMPANSVTTLVLQP